jgi:hypothetical protein
MVNTKEVNASLGLAFPMQSGISGSPPRRKCANRRLDFLIAVVPEPHEAGLPLNAGTALKSLRLQTADHKVGLGCRAGTMYGQHSFGLEPKG